MRNTHHVTLWVSLFAAVTVTGCGTDDAPADPEVPTELQLPGPAFYPTSIHAASDGTLFVGSAGTGEVVRFSADTREPSVIVAQESPPIVIPGLFVDDANQTLYVCADYFGPGFSMPVAALRSYDLDGRLQRTYPLPSPGTSLCEDVAVDAHGNAYITDAFNGVIYVLDGPEGTIREWASSEMLRPGSNPVPPFGAHGLAYDGSGNLYVDNFNTSALLRFPINADGSAGTPTTVTVTPALTNPEALRVIDANHMVVVEDIWASPDGRLTELTFSGPDTATSTLLRGNLRGPTSVAVSGGSYWVTEGQISHLIAGTTPDLPFLVLTSR